MISKIFETTQAIGQRESCRQGVLLTLNGLMNSMSKMAIDQVASTNIIIIADTLEGPQHDAACKRMATGLF